MVLSTKHFHPDNEEFCVSVCVSVCQCVSVCVCVVIIILGGPLEGWSLMGVRVGGACEGGGVERGN